MSRLREQAPRSVGIPAAGFERSAFVTRLHLILQQWPSADRLARAMGVSPSAFRKWLKGEAEPSRERLVALANAAKVRIGWLATGEGPAPDFGDPDDDRPRTASDGGGLARFVRLPHHPTVAAAGSGTAPDATDAESGYLALRHDWLSDVLDVDPNHVGLEVAIGDSMAPTIRDGNLMLLDTADHGFGQYGIYVLEIEGERLVKRVQRRLDGSLVLISDNTAYERDSVPVDRRDAVRVVGRVVWVGGRV